MPEFLNIFLCCLQCTLIALAAPATLDTSASALNLFTTSLLSGDVPGSPPPAPHPLSLNTSTLLTLMTLNAMLPYRVPNTPTRLNFVLYHTPIDRADLGHTIRRTQEALRAQLARTHQLRDLPLQPDDEPYKSNPHWTGCFLGIIANPPRRPPGYLIEYHLTYGVVENVLQGLWDFLYSGDRFVEAAFEILDDRWGLVGLGKVSVQRIG